MCHPICDNVDLVILGAMVLQANVQLVYYNRATLLQGWRELRAALRKTKA